MLVRETDSVTASAPKVVQGISDVRAQLSLAMSPLHSPAHGAARPVLHNPCCERWTRRRWRDWSLTLCCLCLWIQSHLQWRLRSKSELSWPLFLEFGCVLTAHTAIHRSNPVKMHLGVMQKQWEAWLVAAMVWWELWNVRRAAVVCIFIFGTLCKELTSITPLGKLQTR